MGGNARWGAALEDKIVQRAVAEVLNAIYEEDFLGFSYGFRLGRGQHDPLDTLAVGITRTRVNWIVDADIAGLFDAISHEWPMRFVEHRVGDRRINRLIRTWLKACVIPLYWRIVNFFLLFVWVSTGTETLSSLAKFWVVSDR
jgi:hypothetical protein